MEHVLREKAKAFWALRRTYEAIAKQGNFSWYEKVESPREDEIEKYHDLMADGASYDPMTNIITTKDGVRMDLKTEEVYA